MFNAKNAPKPSQTLKAAALTMLAARGVANDLRPKIKQIQADILTTHEFVFVDRYAHRYSTPEERAEAAKPQRLADFKLTYQLDDADAERLFQILDEEYTRAGYVERKPGECPLLIAQGVEIRATHLFVEASQELHTVFDVTDLRVISLEKYREYVELTTKYVTRFITDADRAR